jgi:tRNA A-37 threonylcarbamoyl transferase component Bud32
MNNIDIIINEKIQKNPKIEIFNITFNSKKLWVKRARKTGSNLFHKLIYKLIKNSLLIPVQDKNPKDSIEYEASKLTRLRALNISVPRLITKEENYFVIEDCGSTVAHLFYHNQIKDQMQLCKKVIRQLATLHNINEFHGASQIKNFTYLNEKIYFIDFEESFDKSIDIKDLQFRDLFLFLFSIQKMNIDVDYHSLIELYNKLTKKQDTIQRLHSLVKKVSTLMKILENRYIWKLVDRDTKSVYKMMIEFKNIPSS